MVGGGGTQQCAAIESQSAGDGRGDLPKAEPHAWAQSFRLSAGHGAIPEGTAPTVKNTSYTITANLNVPAEGADGVIVTQGGRFAGWGLVVLDGKPVWAYKNTQQPNNGARMSGAKKLKRWRSHHHIGLRL